MILLEHGAQSRSDTLGKEDGYARPDAKKLHVRNRSQLAQKELQFFIAQKQRVAAAQQNVAYGRVAPDVIDLTRELRMKIITRGVAHQPRTGAITAITRATIRDEKQHPVRITVDQPGHGRMAILPAR